MKKYIAFALVFGEVLKNQREKQGISQRMLARSTGSSVQGIRHLEHGRCAPSLATALQMAYGLGMNGHEFIKLLEESGGRESLEKTEMLTS